MGADLVVPALALGFAAYFFWSISGLAWEAKANGVMIGSILVALALAQVARILIKVARGEGTLQTHRLWLPRDVLGKRIGMVVLTVLFIASLKWLGLTLALLLAMSAALRLMGVRRRLPLIVVPLLIAAAAYGLFIAALDADFPHGPIERLLAGP